MTDGEKGSGGDAFVSNNPARPAPEGPGTGYRHCPGREEPASSAQRPHGAGSDTTHLLHSPREASPNPAAPTGQLCSSLILLTMILAKCLQLFKAALSLGILVHHCTRGILYTSTSPNLNLIRRTRISHRHSELCTTMSFIYYCKKYLNSILCT